jgi:hypothetical protein
MNKTPRRSFLRWGLAGIVLGGPLFFMSALSPGFDYELSDLDKPIILLVALMMVAGGIYLFVIHGFKGTVFNRGLLGWTIVIGLLFRLGMLTSTPMLEDDHFRYLWDGGVLANGFNPYMYAPQEILAEEAGHIPDALRQLGRDYGPNLRRVNFPWLRTIYPPMAELAFALAHIIRPWGMEAWRLVLMGLDVLTLYLLFTILRRLKLPPMGLVIYWWNPLLIKEIYNSGHMEVVIFPFLLGALLLAIQHRYVLASGVLGLAVGAKFWPALLLPVILRPLLRDPRRLVPSALVFACVSIAMFLPFYFSGLEADSGLTSYSKHWEMNDTLFMLMLWTVKFTGRIFGLDAFYAQTATRAVVALILLIWTSWVIRRDDRDPAEIVRRCLLVVAGLFLLSPTQFPWYYLWLLPFLAIRPQFSLLFLTVLLPLYYLRSFLSARQMTQIHDLGIVWLEFVPVWGFLLWEAWQRSIERVKAGEDTVRYAR